jgi:AbrB family looped-hinge helix DNA binding protein
LKLPIRLPFGNISEMELTIDRLGRVLIPKAIRDRLKLKPGSAIELDVVGDHLELKPRREEAEISEEHGVLVFRPKTEERLSAEDVRRILEEERDSRFR